MIPLYSVSDKIWNLIYVYLIPFFYGFRNGSWSEAGCHVNSTNITHTVCHCYHLTSFAVLMSVKEDISQISVSNFQYLRHGLAIKLSPFLISWIKLKTFSRVVVHILLLQNQWRPCGWEKDIGLWIWRSGLRTVIRLEFFPCHANDAGASFDRLHFSLHFSSS